MKVAVLADIHANAPALTAVLKAVDIAHIKKLYVAGDLIDYYYDVAEIFQLLAPYDVTFVRGNHEDMLKAYRCEKIEGLVSKYGSGLKVACENLTNEQLNWLENLPHPLHFEELDKKVLLSHGSPWCINTYIYPDAEQHIKDKLFEYGEDLIITGHSHYPFVWYKNNQIVINPGSVGQQRDRFLGACWAIWDVTKHSIELKRESYDETEVERQVLHFDPDKPYLKDVLSRGTKTK